MLDCLLAVKQTISLNYEQMSNTRVTVKNGHWGDLSDIALAEDAQPMMQQVVARVYKSHTQMASTFKKKHILNSRTISMHGGKSVNNI